MHDGPVQDLVASSFVVAGAAEQAAAAGDHSGAGALSEVSATDHSTPHRATTFAAGV